MPHLSFPLRVDQFIWATGIEDTFIAEPNNKTQRILDEYVLTQHYEQWKSDIDLISSLGVSAVRYGIPWYRVEPKRGIYERKAWLVANLRKKLERVFQGTGTTCKRHSPF